MRTHLVLVSLLAALASAAAAAPPPIAEPSAVDDSATAFACTLETLRTGAYCVLEGDPASPFAATPARTATQIGEVLCADAARPSGEVRPDPVTQRVCQAEVQQRLEACADEKATVLDAAGQFVPSARACYAALSAVLAKVRTQAALVAPCCRCLADHRCAGAGACAERAPGAPVPPAGWSCAAKACAEVCGSSLGAEEDVPDDVEPGEGPARHRSSPSVHATPVKDI